MECDHLCGTMLDAAAKLIPTPVELQNQLRFCVKCFAEFESLCRTLDPLGEWRVLHPSPGFESQLRDRLRRDMRAPAADQTIVARQLTTVSSSKPKVVILEWRERRDSNPRPLSDKQTFSAAELRPSL